MHLCARSEKQQIYVGSFVQLSCSLLYNNALLLGKAVMTKWMAQYLLALNCDVVLEPLGLDTWCSYLTVLLQLTLTPESSYLAVKQFTQDFTRKPEIPE